MAVTRKDFEAVAKVIKQERDTAIHIGDEGARITTVGIALGLAHVFAEANPRFDRAVFLKTCGL